MAIAHATPENASRLSISPALTSTIAMEQMFKAFQDLIGDASGCKTECAGCGLPSGGDAEVKLKRCSRCNDVVFCSKECIKACWKEHKPNCMDEGAKISFLQEKYAATLGRQSDSDGAPRPPTLSLEAAKLALEMACHEQRAAHLLVVILATGGMYVMSSEEAFCAELNKAFGVSRRRLSVEKLRELEGALGTGEHTRALSIYRYRLMACLKETVS